MEELNQVIKWFNGFDQDALQALIDEKPPFRTFFQKAMWFEYKSKCTLD